MNVWYFDPFSHKDDRGRSSGGSFHRLEYILIGNLALCETAHNTRMPNKVHTGLVCQGRCSYRQTYNHKNDWNAKAER